VKVEACGICHSDVLVKEGLWPTLQFPRVPGHEVAGLIDAVGDVVSELQKLGGARVILATAPNAQAISALVDGLAPSGKLLVPAAPAEPLTISMFSLINRRTSVAGWYSGTARDSQDTMEFSVLTGVQPMIEKYPLERVAEAYEQMHSGKVRFRVVLTF
jgi:alcohol dehydrogenase, propanol-preferring